MSERKDAIVAILTDPKNRDKYADELADLILCADPATAMIDRVVKLAESADSPAHSMHGRGVAWGGVGGEAAQMANRLAFRSQRGDQ